MKAKRERWAEEIEKRWRKIDQNKTEGKEPSLPHRIHSWCCSQPEGSTKNTTARSPRKWAQTHTQGTHINIGLLSAQTHGRRKTHAGGTAKCSVPICCAPGPLSGGPQSGIQPCQDWHPSHKHTHAHARTHAFARELHRGSRRRAVGALCACLFMCARFHFSPLSRITRDKRWGERVKDTAALLTGGERKEQQSFFFAKLGLRFTYPFQHERLLLLSSCRCPWRENLGC